MSKLIAANWKENPKTETEALALFKAVAKVKRGIAVEVAICPPFIYLEEVVHAYKRMGSKLRFSIGAQDAFWEERGAFTGEVGPQMLRSLGVTYVIIGHSERRTFAKETDEMINKKIVLAVKDKLKVILCVGEGLEIRRKGFSSAKKFVEQQVVKGLKNIPLKNGDVTIAYEPIWAIGSGNSDSPQDARAMVLFIKKLLKERKNIKARVLYGGSVNSGNVADYVQLKDIDGALVGGASLKADEFKKIITILS